ncbi:type I-F CRISPR-associated protein Csy1 [Salinisphaera sp. G21_0]|uniref:type I-F CRISPR-associated protein Csy1 n=1 Tax=Salinisphaera sp. G21_0 TaxID=2821094 RepID=UPI001ADBCBD4|nr:type I-F CRISPR-associated protein Csy1 [Salinisphaera sp. G21_0]MBO9481228.1 type I-F CRISPR-associated protein Csy1 [Salinisphaera sp. G21_0]
MESITRDDVIQAIDQYLSEQLQSKLEPEQKKLDKAEPGSDSEANILKSIENTKHKYSKPMRMEVFATKLAKQLTFGSHFSKGIHPDSKGDNINFRPQNNLPNGIVGSQQALGNELDASGNSAALPLADFFDIQIQGNKLRDLLIGKHPSLEGVFSDDIAASKKYQESFYNSLTSTQESPKASGVNKQLLWPMQNAIKEDSYHNLLPLHPTILIYKAFTKIENARNSEDNKKNKTNRYKKSSESAPYVTTSSIAKCILGGGGFLKSRNVSAITGLQGGVNLLLESLPPTYSRQQDFSLSKRQESFFSRSMAYHCYEALQMLYAVIEAANSNKDIRDQRKEALDLILGQILQMAAYVQQSFPAGWSENYQLKMAHKLWLDPLRANQEGQTAFKQQRERGEWVQTVMQDFALWLNNLLQTRFKKQATAFDDMEFIEWRREIEATIKASQRNNAGIFS